jgi:hypothetical protein
VARTHQPSDPLSQVRGSLEEKHQSGFLERGMYLQHSLWLSLIEYFSVLQNNCKPEYFCVHCESFLHFNLLQLPSLLKTALGVNENSLIETWDNVSNNDEWIGRHTIVPGLGCY